MVLVVAHAFFCPCTCLATAVECCCRMAAIVTTGTLCGNPRPRFLLRTCSHSPLSPLFVQAAASCLASLGLELQPGPIATATAIVAAPGPVGQLGHNDQPGGTSSNGRTGTRGGSGRPVAEAWEEPGAGAGAGRAVGVGAGPGAGESAQVLRYSDSAHESVGPGEGVVYGHRGRAERPSPGTGGGGGQVQGVLPRGLATVQAAVAGAEAWGGEQSAHGGSGWAAGAGGGARLEGWRPVATTPAAREATMAKLQVRGSGETYRV